MALYGTSSYLPRNNMTLNISAQVYVMDADNLGGFYNGAGTPPDASM
jgi:hypothetical protein